jgi:hypothetical protein
LEDGGHGHDALDLAESRMVKVLKLTIWRERMANLKEILKNIEEKKSL